MSELRSSTARCSVISHHQGSAGHTGESSQCPSNLCVRGEKKAHVSPVVCTAVTRKHVPSHMDIYPKSWGYVLQHWRGPSFPLP
ncbi:hypothetical protein ANANG_G00198050 [Anguilla anguilla]|uniref:Uncharacterized protein n=1 Tax=Anguilla anguilla TaxID=7936 RepID=A0A9D3M3N7_ANGAN|nr:hypothetical protein ANANG_G00198050 [Anguilla anguilla]